MGVFIGWIIVALLAEGVDRNPTLALLGLPDLVALLAEGVDRNLPAVPAALVVGCRPPRGGRG